MKKKILSVLLLCGSIFLRAQNIDDVINATTVKRIESILSADEMEGRKIFTPGIDRAANFIADEFKKAGLQSMTGVAGYLQEFTLVKTKITSLQGLLEKDTLNQANCLVATSASELKLSSAAGFETVLINKEADFDKTVGALLQRRQNLLVLVDKLHSPGFSRLRNRFAQFRFGSDYNQLFMLTDKKQAASLQLNMAAAVSSNPLKNVVGMLPGKSQKTEMVLFSGHYDHLGIGKPNAQQDSIYNGANDDASGITAVIMLAHYFAGLKTPPERTLVFVAFTAEETGGYGSRYFSQQLDADKVTAMFNIEMIGTESKWGRNSAYITGFEKSSMGTILQANLSGTAFKFEPDPYPAQSLFYRSDNATLAALGVPAHTISTSKMDSEQFYHTQEDELETLDMDNMAAIIRSVALSAQTIISGKDTPTRVPKPAQR